MLGLLDCFLLQCKFAVQSLNQVDLVTEGILNFETFLRFNLYLAIDQVDAFDTLVIGFFENFHSADQFRK